MTDELFTADGDGLRGALERLLALRDDPGSPVPDASLPDLPDRLPEQGVGTDQAVALAADVGVGRAVRLDHPGYLAHMDPPTAWLTWATAMMAA